MSRSAYIFITVIVILSSLFFVSCTSRTETAQEIQDPAAEPTTTPVTASPTASPEPSPVLSPAPSPTPSPSSEPTPVPAPSIVITKQPNDDPGIIEGNTQISIARAENGDLLHWQFTPPDGSVIYTDQELESVFPVKVYKIDAETLWIVSIPVSMDGYKVRAVFANDDCEVYTDWASIHVIGFFTQIPKSYIFLSGAGAWSTTVDINDDGTFSGFFHDWDAMGPDGIQSFQSECRFTGQFGKVGKIADHIYTMEILSFSQDGTNGDRYVDEIGTTHETTEAYGFGNASLFYVYTPGVSVSELQEAFGTWYNINSWPNLYSQDGQTLSAYGLYNYYGGYGFIEAPYA